MVSGLDTINYSKFRTHLSACLKECSELGRRFVISRNDKPEAVVVSVEEWESIMETLAVLSDPALMRQLRQSEKDVRHGRVHSVEEVFAELLADDK